MLSNFIKRALRRRFDFADRAELKSAVNLRRFKAAAKFVVFKYIKRKNLIQKPDTRYQNDK